VLGCGIVIDEPAQSVRMPPGSRTVSFTPNGAISWAKPMENPAMAHFSDKAFETNGCGDWTRT
jgi:hypothetical protein